MKNFKLTLLALCCVLCFSCDKELEETPNDGAYSITLYESSGNSGYCSPDASIDVYFDENGTLDFVINSIKLGSSYAPEMDLYFYDLDYYSSNGASIVSESSYDPYYTTESYGNGYASNVNGSSYTFTNIVLSITDNAIEGSFTLDSSSYTYYYSFTGTAN